MNTTLVVMVALFALIVVVAFVVFRRQASVEIKGLVSIDAGRQARLHEGRLAAAARAVSQVPLSAISSSRPAEISRSLNDHNRPPIIVTARLVISVRSNPITP